MVEATAQSKSKDKQETKKTNGTPDAGESRNQKLFERAKNVIPGGVNSPARACIAVESEPIFIERADGPYLYDVEDTEYLDYVLSWGPMILGHRHPRVLEASEAAIDRGTSYGAPCRAEVELAELVCELVPSIEMVRMVNSGTEACMSAVRVARAFTKRNTILKFDGCYHGHADSFLVKAGSGLATLGIASTPGVPEAFTKETISVPYNDLDAVSKCFQEHKDKIAAIIVEPILANSGVIPPQSGFLEGLADMCKKHGSLLIFDEVMTGFRVARGGAQQLYKITPDLTCLGKVLGGGFPVGAYGGRKDVMSMVAPLGSVYQAGTLSGNPVAMAAGLAQLRVLKNEKLFSEMNEHTEQLASGLRQVLKNLSCPGSVASVCGMITVFFQAKEVSDFAAAQKCDTKMFAKVWQGLLKEGIYWPPSQFEAAFLSTMHTKKIIDKTISSFEKAIKAAG